MKSYFSTRTLVSPMPLPTGIWSDNCLSVDLMSYLLLKMAARELGRNLITMNYITERECTLLLPAQWCRNMCKTGK